MSQISVDTITDEAGTGAPSFPNGLTGDGSALTGIDTNPHKPVAVTGTTPSLDVGDYNFFNNGTLTGDTTVSFASVPTDARWSYSFNPVTLVGLWDVTEATSLRSFSVADQDTAPFEVFFKPDGLKMYVLGNTGDDINEYDLRTAWDVSTATYLQLFSIAAQETSPYGLFFKPDGTKMYVLGQSGDDVNEYDLSTAWDVSTAVFLQLFSIAAQDTLPRGLFFKPDGTKMYVMGQEGADVNEYDLSTAWNVTTAVFLQLFSVSAQDTAPYSLFFKPDGTKMYMLGASGIDVNEYDLSTAWDVTSAVFLQLLSVLAQDSSPRGFTFKPDGTKMYMVGSSGNSIYEYDLGSPASVTLPAALQNIPSLALVHDTEVTYEFLTDDAGVTVKLIAEEVI